MTQTVQTATMRISFDGKTLTSEIIDNVEIDSDAVKNNFEASKKLVSDKRYLSLVITAPYTTITKEGREASNSPELYMNVIAQAIVVKTLASRIMGNFLVSLYKKYCPQRLFTSRDEADKWLQKQWAKNQVVV